MSSTTDHTLTPRVAVSRAHFAAMGLTGDYWQL